jgi:hypothetical protein
MRKLLFSLFVMMASSMSAVEYCSVGSNADFCVYTFDGNYYLILSFKDDDENRLTDNTIVKFKLKDGTVLSLSGSDGSKATKSSMTHWGMGIMSGGSSDKHFAILSITNEEIEKLKQGVEKVAINTIPECYKRGKWSGKDTFGSKLYEEFKKLKNEFDE